MRPAGDAPHEQRQHLVAIALMCGALASFACLDTMAKFLNGHMDTLQVVWARYAGAFVVAVAISNPFTRPALMRSGRPWLQVGRSILLLGSTLLNFFALRWLQLDQALAIVFTTPFFVAILSGPVLGEWVGWRRWTAICVGFVGVLLVARPGFGGIHPAALISLAAAVFYAGYNISTRLIARTDSNETTLFYSNLVGAVVMMPVVPFVWTTPTDPLVIAVMLVCGAFGTVGHYMLIAAHRLAPPSMLAPFIYSQLVWVILLGYLVFADVPSFWTLTGAAVVVASGLYMLYREQLVGRSGLSLRRGE
jgi:drug/metabolite transporter (DMT)-like permease